ncbi:MAG: response regulator transcription factor [Actinobacteria bacterium]|nr:MAG: response regulator transcription factor [Actinomycetota bacterium]
MSLSASTTHDDGTAAAPEQPVRDRANAPSRGPVRVLLVADTEIIVRGLAGLLDRSRDRVELLGPISASDDVAAAAAAYRADVVLVDADRKGGVDVALLARLLGASEGLRLVVFTHSSDERRLFEALRAGTAGYLLKSLSAVELVHHLERARDGQVVIDPSLASRLALAMGRSRALGGWPGARLGLSQRESDVLALLVDGLANREIAERLFVGQETVKTHLHSLYRKLAVRDRAGAVGLALRDGIFN